MGKKAKVIIVILSMLVLGLAAYIVTDKFILDKNNDNTSKISSKNSTDKINSVEKSNTSKEENIISKEEKNNEKKEEKTHTTESQKQIDAVKKALKDKEWLAKNILVQDEENYNDAENIGTQVANFIVCKRSSDTPVIIIQVSAEDIRYSKVMLVAYSKTDDKVVATKINEGHIYHGAYTVDANKCVVNSLYMHGGAETMLFHSVAAGNLKFIGGYGSRDTYENEESTLKYFIYKESKYDDPEEVSKDEYDKYKGSLNESQYNFVEIGTELNDTNVEKYIK